MNWAERGGIPSTVGNDSDRWLQASREEANIVERRPDRTGIMFLLAIVGVALAVRALHFVAIARTAFPQFPVLFTESDMSTFWEWAKRIADGDWLGRNTYHPYFQWMHAIADEATFERWGGGKAVFHQAPLYPYWLALLRVAGGTLTSVLWIQLVVGALQPLVIFALGRRLFDRTSALAAAALSAVYGPLIFFQGSLLRDWLPLLLEPLALVALLRASERSRLFPWLIAGATIGLAALAKETALILIPISLGWCVACFRSRWKPMASSAALLVAGFLLCLAPLVARNVAVGAPWFRLSASGAGSFILGFAAAGTPIGFSVPPSLPEIFARSDGHFMAVIRETLATYHGHYAGLLGMQWMKFRGIVDPFEAADNLSYYYGLGISPVLRFCPGYGIILPLAGAGLALCVRRRRDHLLVIAYMLGTLGGLMFSIVHARYRLVLVPPLLLYAGTFMVATIRSVRDRRPERAIIAMALVAVFAVLQHVVLPVVPTTRYARHQEYLLAADLYKQRGEWDRAAVEIERLLRTIDPAGMLAPQVPLYEGLRRQYWGLNLLQRGQTQEAQREFEAAVTVAPGLAMPHYFLGLLQLKEGGNPAAGKAQLQRFLELQPVGRQADGVRTLLRSETGQP